MDTKAIIEAQARRLSNETSPSDETYPLPNPFDPLCVQEVLHMSSFLTRSVDEELAEHPAIKARPEWRELAEGAVHLLAKLYQAIGASTVERDANHEREAE